jgi:hypothetical protein
MTVIAEKDRETIRQMLADELVEDVELVLFTRPRSPLYVPGRQDCQTCGETRELLEELVGLSDRLSLAVHDASTEPEAVARFGVREVPAIFVRRRTEAAVENGAAAVASSGDTSTSGAAAQAPPDGKGVRFLGLPAGYEFSTLLADIVDLSKGRTDLAEPTREAVRAIEQPVHIRVFVTPT